MLIAIILVFALGIRVALDLIGMARPDVRLDAAYSALFGVVAVLVLLEDPRDYFGYISIVLSCFYGLKTLVANTRPCQTQIPGLKK